jgi:thioredoxin reductase (NADPH)
VRDFLTRAAQPHEWLEAGTPEADRLLASMGLVEPPLPVVLDGDRAYVGASVETLVSAWNLTTAPKRSHYDLAIVGAGPAGLGAACTPPPTDSRRSRSNATFQAVRPRIPR